MTPATSSQLEPASSATTSPNPPVLPAPVPAAAPGSPPSSELRELRRFHFATPGAQEFSDRDGPGLVPAALVAAEKALDETAAAEAAELGTELEPLLSTGPAMPLHLLRHAAASRLRPARGAFRDELRTLLERSQDLLGTAPNRRFETTMGALGTRFVDPDALSGVLERPRGAGAAAPAHRESLEDAFATLRLLADARFPELIVVHDSGHGVRGLDELESVSGDGECICCLVEHDDPCTGAAELFDHEAEKLAQMLRAVRRIRLEAEGAYQAELHDLWLEQLDWQAFSRDELQLLPPIVALVSEDQAAGQGMASLSHLLLSGRPVQVLVMAQPWKNPGTAAGDEPLAGYRFEPAYLGLSHREALVQQTSTARPAHMLEGFLRSLRATHASLHVVDAEVPTAAAALEGRAHPLFHYDPEAGTSWSDRLDFSHNPHDEGDWPVHEMGIRRHDRRDDTLSLPFTFADFALLEPSYAHHFTRVGSHVPDDELISMADYCAVSVADETTKIPFVWGLDGDGHLHRVAVSRPLAMACRDRLDFWRTLQELAGLRRESERQAAEQARTSAEAAARERMEALEASYAEEAQRLRRDATREVVDRLTAALLAGDGAFAELAPAPAAVPAVSASLAGRGVDEVASILLAIADPATL